MYSGYERKIFLEVMQFFTSFLVKLNKLFNQWLAQYAKSFTGESFKDIKKAFRNILKQAQIKNFRFYDLRHTAATRMVEKGIPLRLFKNFYDTLKFQLQ